MENWNFGEIAAAAIIIDNAICFPRMVVNKSIPTVTAISFVTYKTGFSCKRYPALIAEMHCEVRTARRLAVNEEIIKSTRYLTLAIVKSV